MATIGTFRKSGNEYTGEIVTLALQRNLRLVPETRAASANAPSHRVYAGRVEIGAAWEKVSQTDGRPYLGVKLDDPSLKDPIYASLFDDEGGETYSLVWTRPVRRDAN